MESKREPQLELEPDLEPLGEPTSDKDGRGPPTYAGALHDVAAALKSVVTSELKLFRLELTESGGRFGAHTAQAALFGALLAISALPFLAFLVIVRRGRGARGAAHVGLLFRNDLLLRS